PTGWDGVAIPSPQSPNPPSPDPSVSIPDRVSDRAALLFLQRKPATARTGYSLQREQAQLPLEGLRAAELVVVEANRLSLIESVPAAGQMKALLQQGGEHPRTRHALAEAGVVVPAVAALADQAHDM